jgi:two-component system NarL family response regulator
VRKEVATMAATQGESKNLGVLMIDFSPLVREGLQAILAKDSEIQFMGDSPDGPHALMDIRRARGQGRTVHVVLTETRNGELDGVQVTRLIKDEFPDIAVLVLTENLNDSYVIDAIHAGAGGYIFLKDTSPEILLQSIHRVFEGGVQMKAALLHAAVENLIQNGRKTLAERTTKAAHLTGREVDVLRLMGNGDSNKMIAATLGITLETTKKHVRNATDKLQARSRTHAAIIAAQAGIVGNPIAVVLEEQSKLRLAA